MNKVKIGVIGLGQRGVELLSTMLFCDEADIVAMGGAPQPVPDFTRGTIANSTIDNFFIVFSPCLLLCAKHLFYNSAKSDGTPQA